MAGHLTICNPVASGPKATMRLAPLPETIQGSRVGFRVQWNSFDVFMQEMETVLREKYDVPDVFWWDLGKIQDEAGVRASEPAAFGLLADKFAEESDWAILGLAA